MARFCPKCGHKISPIVEDQHIEPELSSDVSKKWEVIQSAINNFLSRGLVNLQKLTKRQKTATLLLGIASVVVISLFSLLGDDKSVSTRQSEFPSDNQFFSALYSQAGYLEQCQSNEMISITNVHNENMNLALEFGFTLEDYWEELKKGSGG